MRLPFKFLRGLLWSIWIVYVAAAVGLLGLRYFVLPRIDQWRPQIERYASEAIGAPVRIGHIEANWSRLNPRLTLTGVEIADGAGAPVLSLPAVDAVLGWRSILTREPRLLFLQADGLDLTLRRDRDDRLWVAGQSFSLSDADADDGSRSVALRWLARQREIVLRHATVRWVDESRAAPELVLSDASFVVLNGALSHRFSLQARPPGALAAALTLRGEVERSIFSRHPMDLASWHGQVYAELGDGEPSAWAPWLDLPPLQGRMAARAWMQIDGRKLGTVTMDLVARGLGWRWQDGVAASANTVRARLEGLPGDLARDGHFPALARSANGDGLALRGTATRVRADLPGIIEQPRLAFAAVQLDTTARRSRDGILGLELRDFQAANEDLDLRLQGKWEARGTTDAGTADIQGTLRRATMSAIHRYLPLSVSEDARQWLAQGLQAGMVHDADLVLRGDLNDFPFTQSGQNGRFHIGGPFVGATVDYAPATSGHKAWPAILGMDGNFSIEGASLSLEAKPGATLRPADDRDAAASTPILLGAVGATIPDMEENAELYLQGDAQGQVPAFLSLVNNSPLGGLLENRLAQARGKGLWQVALALRVPLMHTDDTTVQGSLSFNDNEFTLYPQLPALTQLRGMLEFTEEDLRARDVQAQFLGGPLRVNGGLLDTRNGLRFDGQVTGAALAQLVRAPAMSRFSGRAAVRGKLLYFRGGRVDVTMESDLAGMAIDMPAPVGKTAGATLPLRVQWSPAAGSGGKDRDWLTASLGAPSGDNVNLLLERDPAEKRWTFARGALAANQPATLPAQGMSVRLNLPDIDVDGWQDVVDGFDTPPPAAGRGRRAPEVPLLPPPDAIALETPRLRVAGVTLNDLKLNAVHPAPAQWRVDIQSRQAAGAVTWREASGAIAGQVTARFKYLSLGDDGDDQRPDDQSSGDDLKDIPAIDLQADTLRFYGKDLGSLRVVGTNVERGQRWRLDTLRIASADATLDASGFWRLSGPERGLTVDANAKWDDFGKLLTRLGWSDMAAGGAGTAEGKLTWLDLPWSHRVDAIDGNLKLRMDKGRLLHLNSRTARLLELLSMQSLQRLAKLELNPVNLFRDGFPFDSIRARFNVSKGVIRTDDYKVNGPVAAIVLSGSSSIIDETWDLKAVVIPNLDASGAAVATALAVNPLLGLGAFVTQWLLKYPLARAMTVQYAVTGPWGDPKVSPIDGPLPASEAGEPPPKDPIEH
ncbi:TIGR02099 family protein [Bordetella genomosp. 9]|uniref:TIGR02099 family protein n=1 Tax=Bordetella genomosp. 9 TaxID=1416803 RepID=A0A261RFN2_9BORD|nr:YhdP family protein [Bordetella genomosp. 9]OZI23492.1 TIGR02099 family protein [Bordetella genomosp. 9]